MMDATVFLQIAWSSVAGASFYILVAVAFALYLKVTTYWNFAQAAQIGIAFYLLHALVRVLGWPEWAALIATFFVVAIFGLALEIWGFRVLRRRNSPHLTYFIFTFMVAQFFGFLLMLLGGTEPRSLVASLFMPGSLVIGVSVTPWDIEAIAATLLILAAIAFLLTRTALGERILAVSDNRQLAELYGISAERIYLLTSTVCSLPLVVAVPADNWPRLATDSHGRLHLGRCWQRDRCCSRSACDQPDAWFFDIYCALHMGERIGLLRAYSGGGIFASWLRGGVDLPRGAPPRFPHESDSIIDAADQGRLRIPWNTS